MNDLKLSSLRFRPRFSLLTVLLVMALVACGITIWQLWREVGPLRAEVRESRTELGRLNIDDPRRAYAIQLNTGEPRTWKWRIYLPPDVGFTISCYSGTLPSPNDYHGNAWYDRVKNGGIGSGFTGSIDGGEFTLEAKLEKDGDRWVLVTTTSAGRGSSRHTIAQPSGDWLSDTENFSSSSGVGPREQTVFEPGEPIMLLKALKPIITRFPGGHDSRDPEGAADGFVLWINQ